MTSTYRDLEAWQQAMALVERCYVVTKSFPREEQFGLTSQLRRAAVSIPSNVAEGACRKHDAVFRNHIAIALGSQAELETCIEIAHRLKYLDDQRSNELMKHCGVTGKLLNGLFRSLHRDNQH